MPLSRRALLLSAAAAGCGGYREPVLTVFSWAGPWGRTFDRVLKPLFEKATGARVIFDNGWGEELPKLLASPPDQPPYDVMIVAPFQIYPLIRKGLFARLDFELIPNLKAFAPQALSNWIAREQWGLTWPDAMHTGVYRTDLGAPPSSWRDILDAGPGFYRASYMTLYTFAAAMHPGSAAEAIELDFDAVFDFARRERGRVRHWWTTSPDMAFHLLRGEVPSGNIHSVDVFAMFAENKPVDVFLGEDRAHFQAIWLVPKGTRYNALAHEFLNQFASREFQQEYAAAGFPTPIADVAAERASADPLWARLYPHQAGDFDRLRYYPYDAYVKHWGAMTGQWTREVLVS